MADSSKLWNFGFVYILACAFASSVAFNMIMPITPDFAVYMGASLTFAGIFTGVFALAALFARPFANVLGDRADKKLMLILALSANGLVVMLYAIAPNFAWLMPIRILHGIFFSAGITMSMVIGVFFVPKERLGEGLGYISVAFLIGTAAGPNLSIILTENFSFHASFLVSGTITFLVGLAIIFLPYNHVKVESVKKKYSLNDFVALELLPNVILIAVLTIGIGLVNSYIVMLGGERGISGIGLFFVVNAVLLMITRPYLGKLSDRKGVHYAVIPGFIFTSMGLILIGFSYSLWMILIAAAIIAVGNSTAPALQAESIRKLSIERRTVATGTFLIGIDLGMGLGMAFGGVFTDAFSFDAVFISMGIFVFIALGVYLLYLRKGRINFDALKNT